jgi:23S rRNA pseudouridine1911/1915/1917 synthase
MTARRWVTGPGDGRTVGEVLALAGADAHALRDGRVFIGRKRARAAHDPVAVGDVVEVAPPGLAATTPLVILAREGDVIAVDKPAGMPTIADHRGAADALVTRVARELDVDPSRVHPSSRLDRDVSGVVTFALSRRAAARLLEAREAGRYDRRYAAVALSEPRPSHGQWAAPIGRARDPRLRRADGEGAIAALTRYATAARASCGEAMLAVTPITGRTHQIRVHAAHAGVPLVGDLDYGGRARFTLPGGAVLELRRIALHAARVVIRAARGTPFVAEAPVPAELEQLWARLGGAPDAWNLCVAMEVP